MELERYDETIHPEVWLNKIKLYCYKNQITKNEDIIEVCKSAIHPSINLSKANTFDEIINILKSDIFFISYKFSAKKKLQALSFDPINENHVHFINKFREYCYEAEINDIEEQKKLLLRKISEDSYQYKILNDNLEKIKSLNDLILFFNETFLDEKEILIKHGSRVSLKHVATGKYLSGCDKRYKTGSEKEIVFASATLLNPNSLWIISNHEINKNNPIIYYGSKIKLTHKSNKYLYISNRYKSPSTGNMEVRCSDTHQLFCIKSNSTNNNNTCVRSKEIINLYGGPSENFILRSHEFPFAIGDDTFQEVVGHKEKIDGNDDWCIELVENE